MCVFVLAKSATIVFVVPLAFFKRFCFENYPNFLVKAVESVSHRFFPLFPIFVKMPSSKCSCNFANFLKVCPCFL